MYLILINAHSKWIDVHITSGCTTATTIEKLQLSFSTFGLPQVRVSDNSPAFSSAKLQHFMKQNGINHAKTIPYHPASNGLTERAVKTFRTLVLCSHESMIFCLSIESPHTLPRVLPQPNCYLDVSCILSWTYSSQVLLTRYSAIKICKSRHMITMLETDNYS